MSRWHVRFMIGGREHSDPSASELRSMTSGDHVIVTFGAAKNDPLSLIWGNRCAYLPFVGSNPLRGSTLVKPTSSFGAITKATFTRIYSQTQTHIQHEPHQSH